MVESIAPVEVRSISDTEARTAGFDDAAAMRREMRWTDDLVVQRIAFHREDATAPPSPPTLDDDAIDGRLDRLDTMSPTGPWTRATLDVIARRPGVHTETLPPSSVANASRSRPTCASSSGSD